MTNKTVPIAKKKDNIEKQQVVAIVQLINKHFWKTKVGPISAISIPLFLMIVYKVLSQNDSSSFASGLPSYLSFSILPLCFISLPQMIIEFKTSIVLRKISNSRITAIEFILIVIAYNLVAVFGATVLIFILYAIFLNVDVPWAFGIINWGNLIYSLLNIFICSLPFGLLLGVLIHRIALIQVIGFSLIIISITLSGELIPMNFLYRNRGVAYVTLFSPITYSLNLMNVSLLSNNYDDAIKLINQIQDLPIDKLPGYEQVVQQINEFKNYRNSGIFDVHNDFKMFSFGIGLLPNPDGEGKPIQYISSVRIITIYQPWQTILNLVMPYVVSIVSSVISIKKFRWLSR